MRGIPLCGQPSAARFAGARAVQGGAKRLPIRSRLPVPSHTKAFENSFQTDPDLQTVF